jgi:RNA polymerase sigma-70 factor (ECF subfamily)
VRPRADRSREEEKSMEHKSEEQTWIARAQAGDQEAFNNLVWMYQTAVYNLAYRMMGDRMEAEDAAQETFVRAYTRLSTYDPQRKFASWLLAIASHYCIDRLRRRRFTWLPLDELPPWDQPGGERDQPEAATLQRESQDELHELLGTLPPDYRAAVTLYYWNDLSYREIAEVMDTTEGAIKSRLFRARRMMAEAALARSKGVAPRASNSQPVEALQGG